MRASKRDWMFRVQVPGLEKNDVVFVVGNLPELGAWNHNQAIQLTKENDGSESPPAFDNNSSAEFNDLYGNSTDGLDSGRDHTSEDSEDEGRIFSQKVALPADADVQFRFFIAVVCHPNGTKNSARTLIIRKWETHMKPRQISKNSLNNFTGESIPEPEKFGYHNGYYKVERGWLTDETVIQFKILNNPIKLWKNKLQNKNVHIKMTPVNLVRHNSLELQQLEGHCVDDSLSMDTQDIVDQPAFSITEIAVMNDEEATFKYQSQFGRAYHDDEFLIFNVAVRYPETVFDVIIHECSKPQVHGNYESDNSLWTRDSSSLVTMDPGCFRIKMVHYRSVYVMMLRVTWLCLLMIEQIKFSIRRLNRRRWWVKPHLRMRERFGAYATIFTYFKLRDEEEFFKFTGMPLDQFKKLHRLVRHRLRKRSPRGSLSPELKLAATLNFLVHGTSLVKLAWYYLIGRSTMYAFVPDVCQAIIDVMRARYLKFPSAQQEWDNVSEGFLRKYNIPNCLGALDGKHFRIRQPPNSGALFWNWKRFYSVNVMAVCDSDGYFMWVSTGGFGSLNDSTVFRATNLGAALYSDQFPIVNQGMQLHNTDI
ncbi:hypothetical protein QAD02_007387 [Eretmocerus hayati]|uniref:Uncharacterized protein n=1 Tax=Eretmocerus hayati TaxID=131215 RepID=A0ACC2N3G9_9HYME|nr:hypothetical protein QAD02_007387 [Eretmocerus hayati]